MGSVCFISYIPYGNPCVQSDCSRLLVCARVLYVSSFLGLRSASVALCAALLFL